MNRRMKMKHMEPAQLREVKAERKRKAADTRQRKRAGMSVNKWRARK